MGKRLTLADFISRASSVHNHKFDYSMVKYKNNSTKVDIICPVHGIFSQRPVDHLLGRGCKRCSSDSVKIKLTSNTSQFIKKAIQVHGNVYSYDKVKYINATTKVTITCPVHGDFIQLPNNHLGGSGCNKCGYDKSSQLNSSDRDSFIGKSKKVHGGTYNYDRVNYINSANNVTITCPIHGDFEQLPGNHIHNKSGCPYCVSTGFQREIVEYIKTIYDGSIFYNTRAIIAPRELDIYLPSKRIAIECNGNYWHSTAIINDKQYHLKKTNECRSKNIQLIHIFEDEWKDKHKQSIVKARLKHIITNDMKRIYARKCVVREIDIKTKGKFLNKYHLQGNDRAKVKLGLFYKNRLVAVMTFCKARFSKKYEWELSRYATIANFTIVGGAGKLLKYFERNYNPTSLVTYADRRWSTGNLYSKLGFTFSHNSSPNYFYVNRKTDNLLRESRHNYQKHKLSNKLNIFDSSKSEVHNMLLNGYYQIFDSGNMIFYKKY
jgi:hypothetical protein